MVCNRGGEWLCLWSESQGRGGALLCLCNRGGEGLCH